MEKQINFDKVCYCVIIYFYHLPLHVFLCCSNWDVELGFTRIQNFTILSQLHLCYRHLPSKICLIFRLIWPGNYKRNENAERVKNLADTNHSSTILKCSVQKKKNILKGLSKDQTMQIQNVLSLRTCFKPDPLLLCSSRCSE